MVTTGSSFAPEVRPVWQTAEDLLAYAETCSIHRELTAVEREQFDLRATER